MILLLLACDGDGPGPALLPDEEEDLVEVWPVEGLTWDLAVMDGRLVSTTQFGGSLFAWDPSSDEEEEIGDDLGETLGVVVVDGQVLFSVTDSGMTGYVARLDEIRRWTELVSAGDGGLPMRRPEDLVMGPDGFIYAADPGAEAVWRIATDGSTAKVVTRGVKPTAVGFHEDALHWTTETGVFRWEDEQAVQILDHGGYGLLSDEGRLLVGTGDGVMSDGELLYAATGLERAGPMARVDGQLYVGDQGQGSVWRVR